MRAHSVSAFGSLVGAATSVDVALGMVRAEVTQAGAGRWLEIVLCSSDRRETCEGSGRNSAYQHEGARGKCGLDLQVL